MELDNLHNVAYAQFLARVAGGHAAEISRQYSAQRANAREDSRRLTADGEPVTQRPASRELCIAIARRLDRNKPITRDGAIWFARMAPPRLRARFETIARSLPDNPTLGDLIDRL